MTAPQQPYTVSAAAAVKRQMRKLDPQVRRQLEPVMRALATNPRPRGCRKLAGYDNLWRVRSGNYRIVYEIHDRELRVRLVRIADRNEATYSNL